MSQLSCRKRNKLQLIPMVVFQPRRSNVALIATLLVSSVLQVVPLLPLNNYWGVSLRKMRTPPLFGLDERSNEEDEIQLIQQQPQKQQQKLTAERAMSLLGTSPRRIFISFASAITISLGTNFLGSTSAVLSLLPEDIVEQSTLDLFYPRGPYKRVRGTEGYDYYSFLIPKSWLADLSVELAKAAKRAKTLDYTKMSSRRRSSTDNIPNVAFGPPGSNSKSRTNVSVVVSKVMPGFTLNGILGTPNNAANELLQTSIAPQGSGREATLLNASEEFRGVSNVYQFEYLLDFFTVDKNDRSGTKSTSNDANDVVIDQRQRLRAISVITERDQDTLLTLTVVAPEAEWQQQEKEKSSQLRNIANSFKLYK